MRAVVIDGFAEPPTVQDVPEPVAPVDGVVVAVEATGLCRSDWHTWQGHDPDVRLPHVAGHELAGRVVEVGADVGRWHVGDRVTVPFVCACGTCPSCLRGDHQICDRQFQPGATHWGSFAGRVAIARADVNLVAVPDAMSSVEAAALGCRFATAFRAVLRQGQVRAGQWVTILGCGGVGISALLLARAAGASVVAVDVSREALDLATRLGATAVVDASSSSAEDLAAQLTSLTDGGAHVSLDCLGSPLTCAASVAALRKRGRHVQVGLMPPSQGVPPIPMHRVVADELEIVGVHGLAAWEYPEMLRLVRDSTIDLGRLVGRRVGLDDIPAELAAMNDPRRAQAGVTVAELAGS